ncbi:MAG TPA: DUF4412 domain-containing protein [Gammaproteobacteria bacterium]|jgi:hypothetical protein
MLKKTAALGLSVALSAAALPALADTHITFVDEKGNVSTQIYVKDGKVRMEGQGGNAVSLYDSASNTDTVLLPGQKKYLRLDNQSTAQVGADADAAQQKIQAALAQHQQEMDQANQQMETATANLTPEQKAMLQQMNQAHAGVNSPATGPAGAMQVTVKELGTTETVAGHSCKDVQVLVNNQLRATDCVVASPASLGIPAADLKTLQAMRASMQKMVSRMGLMGQGMAATMTSGFAIKTTRQSYHNLNTETETDTLKSVSTGDVDAGLFAIPAGYSQTTMQEMMQGGHS